MPLLFLSLLLFLTADHDVRLLTIPHVASCLALAGAVPCLLISGASALSSLFFGLLWSALLFLLSLSCSRRFGMIALGGGDIRLCFALSLYLSPDRQLLFYLFFSLFALLLAALWRPVRRIPLAPAITLGFLCAYLF